jgi:RNA polymerase sigma-70 factor (ECF subfamily)
MDVPPRSPDAASFEQTVLPHLDAAYNLARWLLRDPAAAQDVVQDAAVRALDYFASFRGGDGRAWFLRIVRNTAMTALEKTGRLRVVSLDSAVSADDGDTLAMSIPDDADTPEQSFARAETATALDDALAALPVELRECLVLRELEDFSYRDIAGVTGVPIGTVMSRLWRARQLMARAIRSGVLA